MPRTANTDLCHLVSRKENQDSVHPFLMPVLLPYCMLNAKPSVCICERNEENRCPRHLCIPKTFHSAQVVTLCLN